VLWLGLSLALVSALAVNWAYAKEHDAAAELPRLSFREPVKSVRSLLGARAWVTAFGVETVGFLLYVAALHFAPLSLVQAVGATGIAFLAFVACHGRVHELSWRERCAVALAVAGLVLLGLSLSGTHQSDSSPSAFWVFVWLASCAAAAFLVTRISSARFAPAARFGMAAGLLFAVGDISAKLVSYGGAWFAGLVSLIVGYALGTSTLQGAFQRGGALTAAGIATLTTNAVPIAAGFVLFGEELPDGAAGVLQIAAFACVVLSATLLGRRSL
jgi:drug/metabolite transporter (DMT)-like permease